MRFSIPFELATAAYRPTVAEACGVGALLTIRRGIISLTPTLHLAYPELATNGNNHKYDHRSRMLRGSFAQAGLTEKPTTVKTRWRTGRNKNRGTLCGEAFSGSLGPLALRGRLSQPGSIQQVRATEDGKRGEKRRTAPTMISLQDDGSVLVRLLGNSPTMIHAERNFDATQKEA